MTMRPDFRNQHLRVRGIAFAAALACVLGLGLPTAQAQVNAITDDAVVFAGKRAISTMNFGSSSIIDGINGELTYDTTLLSNPRVSSFDLIAVGNETSPGTFKFVAYEDPIQSKTSQPQVFFVFDAVDPLPGDMSAQTVIAFNSTAAAKVSGDGTSAISIGVGGPGGTPPAETVTFGSFTVFLRPSSVREWNMYESNAGKVIDPSSGRAEFEIAQAE